MKLRHEIKYSVSAALVLVLIVTARDALVGRPSIFSTRAVLGYIASFFIRAVIVIVIAAVTAPSYKDEGRLTLCHDPVYPILAASLLTLAGIFGRGFGVYGAVPFWKSVLIHLLNGAIALFWLGLCFETVGRLREADWVIRHPPTKPRPEKRLRAKKDETEAKRLFRDALLELARTRPVNDISVKDVIKAAGLSRSSFYYNFTDKSELMLYVHKCELDRMMAKVGHDGYTLHDLTLENFAFWQNNLDFWANAAKNTRGPEYYPALAAENAFKTFSKHYLKRNELFVLPEDIAFAMKMYIYGVTDMLTDRALGAKEMTAPEFVALIDKCIPDGLKPFFLGE